MCDQTKVSTLLLLTSPPVLLQICFGRAKFLCFPAACDHRKRFHSHDQENPISSKQIQADRDDKIQNPKSIHTQCIHTKADGQGT